jgi:hypothetical protein
MKTLTLILTDIDENGEICSARVKTEIKEESIPAILFSTYLKADSDLAKRIFEKEEAEKRFLLRKK